MELIVVHKFSIYFVCTQRIGCIVESHKIQVKNEAEKHNSDYYLSEG